MTPFKGFHAHIYFNEFTVDQATDLCEQATALFSIRMGRVHRRNVGPHPRWSCQLAFEPDQFGVIIPWLSMNREGLTVFVHAQTGDDIRDHTDYALWMGEMLELDLSALE
jgi:aromatic ring-cleaving dioxygenase